MVYRTLLVYVLALSVRAEGMSSFNETQWCVLLSSRSRLPASF